MSYASIVIGHEASLTYSECCRPCMHSVPLRQRSIKADVSQAAIRWYCSISSSHMNESPCGGASHVIHWPGASLVGGAAADGDAGIT